MGLLSDNFGYREITRDLLESIGFKEAKHLVMLVNSTRCYPYQLFINVSHLYNCYHQIIYIPEINELRVKEEIYIGRTNREYSIKPTCFEDIMVIVSNYKEKYGSIEFSR